MVVQPIQSHDRVERLEARNVEPSRLFEVIADAERYRRGSLMDVFFLPERRFDVEPLRDV